MIIFFFDRNLFTKYKINKKIFLSIVFSSKSHENIWLVSNYIINMQFESLYVQSYKKELLYLVVP